MKKAFFIVNMLLLAVLLALDVVYIVEKTLLIKAITSSVFVIIGIINTVFAIKSKANLKFPIVMLVGLVLAMLGDILLGIDFIVGAGLFAGGHVLFFISYCMLSKFTLKDLIYGVVIFVPSVLFMVLAPMFEYGGALMEVVCVVYALIISFMVGKSISLLVSQKNMLSLLILIGSVMFFLSDFMLLLVRFGGVAVADILCLVLYYPAEFLLAFSIFVHSLKSKSDTGVKDSDKVGEQ